MPHKHLKRMDECYSERPVFFVTTCTHERKRSLDSSRMQDICREVWRNAEELYGWCVGRYVLMPDHVHFFCYSRTDKTKLQEFVGKWKEWTAKYANRRLNATVPFWQAQFFDHLLRSDESYEEKWNYVRENPVRAGLVSDWTEWPFQGELNQIVYGDIGN